MATLYKLIAIATLGLYAGSCFLGWELEGHEKTRIPASARSSPGGYRSFHFWHTGFHGGK